MHLGATWLCFSCCSCCFFVVCVCLIPFLDCCGLWTTGVFSLCLCGIVCLFIYLFFLKTSFLIFFFVVLKVVIEVSVSQEWSLCTMMFVTCVNCCICYLLFFYFFLRTCVRLWIRACANVWEMCARVRLGVCIILAAGNEGFGMFSLAQSFYFNEMRRCVRLWNWTCA